MSNHVEAEVLKYARDAHNVHGQLRKYTNAPYIQHPIAVSRMVKNLRGSMEMVLASLLHDVLEDTPITYRALFDFLYSLEGLTPDEVITTHNMVANLTDVYTKKNFPELNRKARKDLETKRLGSISDDAKIIKMCDIQDNKLDIFEHDPGFYKVFKVETDKVIECMGYDKNVSFDVNMANQKRGGK